MSNKSRSIDPVLLSDKAEQIRKLKLTIKENFDSLNTTMKEIDGPNSTYQGPSRERLMDEYKTFANNFEGICNLFEKVAIHLESVANQNKDQDNQIATDKA